MDRPLLDIVTETIEKNGMFGRGDRVLAAVSGGVDSMVLLHVLNGLKVSMGFDLAVVHVDHGLRREAKSEGDRVAQACREAALAFHRVEVRVCQREGREKRSIQDAARVARYRSLRRKAEEGRYDYIATGHTASDQAETVLLWLLRGAGLHGLGGMPAVRGNIVRPLLKIKRSEVEAYAAEQGIAYLEDPSNAKPVYLRNRIRHNLMKKLAEYNPNIEEALNRLADIAGEDDRYIEAEAGRSYQALFKPSPDGLVASVTELTALPRALQRRVLRQAIQTVKGDLLHIQWVHLKALEALLSGDGGFRNVDLPGLAVTRQYDLLSLERSSVIRESGLEPPRRASAVLAAQALFPGRNLQKQLIIDKPETVIWEKGIKFVFKILKDVDNWRHLTSRRHVLFDGEIIQFPIVLRTLKSGDRFQPLGMAGHKKLSDLFIDAKVPFSQRALSPLLVSRDEIIWVPGLQVAEPGRITSETRSFLSVEMIVAPEEVRS